MNGDGAALALVTQSERRLLDEASPFSARITRGTWLAMALGMRPLLTASAIAGLIALSSSASADTLEYAITADNAYAIYLGTSTSASLLVASAQNVTAGDIASAESGFAALFGPTNDQFLYVVAYGDRVVAQGLLAEFVVERLAQKFLYTVRGSEPAWRVFATAQTLAEDAPPPTAAQVSQQIAIANAQAGGAGTSGTWKPVFVGPKNDAGAQAYGLVPSIAGIDAGSEWIWYQSGNCPGAQDPFQGCDHGEYLLFRIQLEEVGGCCFPEGQCGIARMGDCMGEWTTYQGAGTTCEGVACTPAPGGCCMPDGACSVIQEAECQAKGGNFGGYLSTCGIDFCNGACCSGTTDCSRMPASVCASIDGRWLGLGTSCNPDACLLPPPACCLAEGVCAQMTTELCAFNGGSPRPEGSSCDPNPCAAPKGACCVAGNCSVKTEEECQAASGLYGGDDSACNAGFCPAPPVDEPADEPGCGCRAAGVSVSGLGVLAWACVAAIGVAARRRRRPA